MTDILHRLHCTIRCDIETAASGCHCAEARDEITRLRAENERLLHALRMGELAMREMGMLSNDSYKIVCAALAAQSAPGKEEA